jgi:hypothetical protein
MLRRVPRAQKSRAEKQPARRMKDPTKRALRGAQKVGRGDMERGVASRARKRIQGQELVPDPKYVAAPVKPNRNGGRRRSPGADARNGEDDAVQRRFGY